MSETGFGLDLAGYSTCGTSLAKAYRGGNEQVVITIYQDTCLAAKTSGWDALAAVNDREIDLIGWCFRQGSLVVDVPIDLQQLPLHDSPHFVWQLTQRAVDRAFDARPPLADRIGAYVARMQQLWRLLRADGPDPLGESLFETYPAACLELLGLDRTGYKGEAIYDGDRWHACGAKKESVHAKNETLARSLNALGWTAAPHTGLRHDEFDAAICALVAVSHESELLADEQLKDALNARLLNAKAVPKGFNPHFAAPLGYQLLAARLPTVHIDFSSFTTATLVREEALA